MKLLGRSSALGLGLAAVLLFVPFSSQAAVVCNDDGQTYETSCSGKPAGTNCINVAGISPIGCCNKGTCKSNGVCDLTNPGGTADDATCINDNELCTTDSCVAQVGTFQAQCLHQPRTGATCVADSNPCTTDTCNASGQCVANNSPQGTSCGGTQCTFNSCDGNGSCSLSTLAAAGTICFADLNICTNDACNGSGTCVATNAPAGQSCGNIDSNVCTRDQCNGSGTCTAGFGGTEDCSGEPPPQNQCRMNVCDTVNGCDGSTTPKPEGTTCNDGKDCSRGDNCHNGQCGRAAGSQGLAIAGAKCRDDNTNHPENRTWCKVGTCDGTHEACQGPIQTLTAGTACDDNPCTTATCQTNGGQCLATSCNASSILCPNCGNTQCDPNGTTGDANQLILCGCLGHLE